MGKTTRNEEGFVFQLCTLTKHGRKNSVPSPSNGVVSPRKNSGEQKRNSSSSESFKDDELTPARRSYSFKKMNSTNSLHSGGLLCAFFLFFPFFFLGIARRRKKIF